MLDSTQALIAAAAMAGTVLFCRALPFLFFSGKKPPKALSFLETSTPAIAMAVLVVASYGSLSWGSGPEPWFQVGAGFAVAILHLWKRNALVSILGGTGLYMLLLAFQG
ncbi:MAG: branched-chain amino acid transport [Spirochaetes bacterium]|nr:MAG: branched-chain amino acid transport [Spirochaetota bacterium]